MMINIKPYFFLLGGHDLEMLEIRSILHEKSLPFYDRNLSWGARLSHYYDLLDSMKGIPVGIELIRDTTPPEDYIEIDHHNEKSGWPTSIEQVAGLLNIELTDYQKLVAANDRGYIPAMKQMGASEELICEIRAKDREAQGVTERDEQLAEKSIENNLEYRNGITVIRSETMKFSAITDRRYGLDHRLLIYTSRNLCFYGNGVALLSARYTDFIKSNKAYSGGGENGFFGLAESAFTETEIIHNWIPEIINLIRHG
ncbi:MAG: hypothetical protein JW861_13550 [Bacteroidales bacterium]|nr:hypothetical protein [Bacteroidales bacterium]